MNKTVVIGLLGTKLDYGRDAKRWSYWRPSVAACQHASLLVHRFELLHSRQNSALAAVIEQDIALVSPDTEVRRHIVEFDDAWDFENVYACLDDFARGLIFDTANEDYLIHITTGTHVAQICLFLLTESRHLPGRLLQTSPDKQNGVVGSYRLIDLDLSRYDKLASRFQREHAENVDFLKGGIETRNKAFNELISRIERVATVSREPILLMGATGVGKSRLARRIYELKKARHAIKGEFVDVNCATIRGDAAMSALFGHKKGSFTGALQDRAGLLKTADGGVLFLDEIGELGPDEQAMLLRAVEEKQFLPLGADRESRSDFQLIAGTNRNLFAEVRAGRFREDLLARISLWNFTLPSLRSRPEDIAPNVDYELDQFEKRTGRRIRFNKEAREWFLKFAAGPGGAWPANFRDFAGAVNRMCTLAEEGRITVADAREEASRLETAWTEPSLPGAVSLDDILGPGRAEEIDPFDRVQLSYVVEVCRRSRSLSAAGRELFSASRARKQSANDADRLKKYLARFGLDWAAVAEPS